MLRFYKSFLYALNGVIILTKTERNFHKNVTTRYKTHTKGQFMGICFLYVKRLTAISYRESR